MAGKTETTRVAAILGAVGDNPDNTTKSLRVILNDAYPGIRKKEINKVLYAGVGVGRVIKTDTGAAPTWNLLQE